MSYLASSQEETCSFLAAFTKQSDFYNPSHKYRSLFMIGSIPGRNKFHLIFLNEYPISHRNIPHYKSKMKFETVSQLV